jgi:hypothetical protein
MPAMRRRPRRKLLLVAAIVPALALIVLLAAPTAGQVGAQATPTPRPAATPGALASPRATPRRAPTPQPAFVPPAGGPQLIHVGVYLVSITNVDISRDTYTLTLYLNFMCDQEPCDPSKFEIVNGGMPDIIDESTDPLFKTYRVQVALFGNLKLNSYPFERYGLRFIIEDQNRDKAQLVYVPDRTLTGIHGNTTIASGWQVKKGLRSFVTDDYYGVFQQTFSRYQFGVTISRPAL